MGKGEDLRGSRRAEFETPTLKLPSSLSLSPFQAQESPEPVFDLSECALKHVPSGVYSRCKVSRKEGLLLHVSESKERERE